MENDEASPGSETASSTGASCPVQDTSQPTTESQEVVCDERGSSSAAVGMATEGESILTGEALEAAVVEIVTLGYTKDQALVVMAASCNNPNRAVEYLLSGGIGAAKERTSESREELSFPVITEDASGEAGDPLTIFASQPQFYQIRQTLSSNPQMLSSFLQQVRRTNPRLHEVICENRERFLQTLNEPIAADAGLGGLGGGGGAAVSGSIVLSQAEHQAVERMSSPDRYFLDLLAKKDRKIKRLERRLYSEDRKMQLLIEFSDCVQMSKKAILKKVSEETYCGRETPEFYIDLIALQTISPDEAKLGMRRYQHKLVYRDFKCKADVKRLADRLASNPHVLNFFGVKMWEALKLTDQVLQSFHT